MFCSKCGRECADTDNVCARCGNRLKKVPLNQQIDFSNAKDVLNTGIVNARESWSDLGPVALKLGIVIGLLVLCMFLWCADIMKVTIEFWGMKQSEYISGYELIGESGLLGFAITALYLVAIAAVCYPIVTKRSFDKKMLLPARAAVGFNFGALLIAIVFGISEVVEGLGGYGLGDLMDYVSFAPSFLGLLLVAAFVATLVLCGIVEKELGSVNAFGSESEIDV